eukprot:1551008-Amphidinium_carterae.2
MAPLLEGGRSPKSNSVLSFPTTCTKTLTFALAAFCSLVLSVQCHHDPHQRSGSESQWRISAPSSLLTGLHQGGLVIGSFPDI